MCANSVLKVASQRGRMNLMRCRIKMAAAHVSYIRLEQRYVVKFVRSQRVQFRNPLVNEGLECDLYLLSQCVNE